MVSKATAQYLMRCKNCGTSFQACEFIKGDLFLTDNAETDLCLICYKKTDINKSIILSKENTPTTLKEKSIILSENICKNCNKNVKYTNSDYCYECRNTPAAIDERTKKMLLKAAEIQIKTGRKMLVANDAAKDLLAEATHKQEQDKIHYELELRAILQDPQLLELINTELEKKVYGEHEARKTIFLVANMRNVKNLNKATDNLLLNATSGTGKDHVTDAVFELIHETEKECLKHTTPKVFAYTRNKLCKQTPNATWIKTALYLEDARNEVLNDPAFKLLASADTNKINKGKSVQNQTIIDIEMEGKPSMILTMADPNPKDETLRRMPICTMDETTNQSIEIMKRQAEYAMCGKSVEYDKKICDAITLLKRLPVLIPYADKLPVYFAPKENPDLSVIVRTHFPRFLDYIKSSCVLHQYQRKTDAEGCLIAEKQDYDIAIMMLKKTTSNILMIPLTKMRQSILDLFVKEHLIQQSVDDLAEHNEIEKLNITPVWLRVQLEWLVSKGFLSKGKQKRCDEAGRIIPKPVFIYGFKSAFKFNMPEFEQLAGNQC